MKKYCSIISSVLKYIFLWDDIAQEHIETPQNSQFAARGRISFLISVTVAAGIFSLIIGAAAKLGGGESATGFSWTTKAEHLLALMLVVFAIAWIWVFLFSIIPYTLGLSLALWKRKEVTRIFFIMGSIVTALLQSLIAVWIFGPGAYEEHDPYELIIFRTAAVFSICGLCAGLACWRILRLPKR